jgi:MFS family permease
MASGGQGMERTATAWLVLVAGGTAFDVGVTFAARMLPSLLFGLIAGTIADRAERARQLFVVAIASFVLMVGFGLFVIGGDVRVWLVVLFAFLAGCVQVFDTPARQALVLDAVPRAEALRALALVALAARFAAAVGAVGGGVLIAAIGVGGAFVATGAVYGVAALLVARLRVVQEHHTREAPPPFRQALGDAARLMIDIPKLRMLIFAGVACEIFAFSYMSAVPLFTQNILQAGAEGLGMLNAAAAIGGAVAVALLSLLPGAGRREPLLAGVFVAYGLAILALAATRDLWLAAGVLLIIGFCAGAYDLLLQTLIQLAVPDAQRGRAVGIWVLSIGSAPLGHLQMGALMGALGVPSALAINGALTLVSATILLGVREFRAGRSKIAD